MDAEIFTSFVELNKKIDTNFNLISKKIDDLCDRATRTEIQVTNHLATQVAKQNARFKILTITIGIIGSMVAIINLSRVFNLI
ncbi:MAG: hypothetical protein WD512_17350 [Candidatus Paceibacterota bacterium]